MKLVILDRDGVINYDSDNFIKSPKEWIPLPGSLEAISLLTATDYKIVIATNQSGVGRGYFDFNTLNNIHEKMLNKIQAFGGNIEKIYFCPHHPDENCDCRKPKPGMFLEISNDFNIDLSNTFAIGDSLRDLQAAITSGAKPVLVKTGKGQTTLNSISFKKLLNNNTNLHHIPVFNDLYDASTNLLIKPNLEH